MKQRKEVEFERLGLFSNGMVKCIHLGHLRLGESVWKLPLLRGVIFLLSLFLFMQLPRIIGPQNWVFFYYNLHNPTHYLWVLMIDLIIYALVFSLLGLSEFLGLKTHEENFESAGVRNSFGQVPKVGRVESKDGVSVVNLDIKGMDVELFEKKKRAIESSSELYLQEIKETSNPRYIDLVFSREKLPRLLEFSQILPKIKAPYRIIMGKAKGGLIWQDPNLWPHALVAGSVGGGKSVMLKSIIAQFIHSTNFKSPENPNPSAQIILCDLKGGVEFAPFSGIPNVSVYSEIKEILDALKKIDEEMEARFKILKEKGDEKIIPEKHKRDFILLCIDESSLLYNQVKKDHPDYKAISEARILTRKILKLCRAAKISVIFGLQRPSKESIDTEVQENIDARICFKVNTLEGSIRMLGNKNGLELPAIPGRGIWKWGSEEEEIQAPYITKKDIEELETQEVELFKTKRKKLKQGLIAGIHPPEISTEANENDYQEKD